MNQKKVVSEVKTFPVSFSLGEVKDNIAITTTSKTQISKQEVINQAVTFHQQGNISEATKYYQYCINQGFNDHRVFSNYGLILKSLGKLQDAESSTRKAIELKPDFALAHYNLGIILNDLGKSKDAELSYFKAIKIRPNYAEAHYNLGVILDNLGKLQKSELSYRRAIKIKPDYAEAHYNLGVILNNLGKLQEAELSYRKAIKLKPDYAVAHSNLGIILKDLGKLKEAELSQLKAIELKPDFAEAHSNLGNILYDLGKLKEAALSQRKAIELKPDFAIAHSNLGNILKDLGKLKEAEISYSIAIELDPDYTIAVMNRAMLFFEEEEFYKALRDSDSINSKDSRAFSLEILYALGKIEEIYKRIETTSKLDKKNIRLAAFSSFISEQQKKDTADNFCKKPLSFLYFSNLKSHVKEYEEFIKGIIKELDGLPTIWEPRTTRNGFQTPININLFSKSSKYISQLKSIILNEIDSYYSKFKKENCFFIQQWPSNKNVMAWYNMLKKQGYQSSHIHTGGWLSGVIYLKVVPSLGKDEGAIEFSLNGQNYSNPNSAQLIHHPNVGDIVFFPSSLHHRTIPFSTDTDRIVIAFDLKPN
tara:strand:- start:136 stop:1908 length:1773 start_codon:yes stop_codon:yes gene_type:complete